MTETDHKPEGHPVIPPAKLGVLISNLGTPDGYGYFAMRRYLSQFLSDRRVIDYSPFFWQPLLQLVILSKRPFTSGAAYRSIWNHDRDESPLRTITREQCEQLRMRLERHIPGEVFVSYSMRYGSPSIFSRVEEMIENGCRRLLFMPLYPQYSATTTATSVDEFNRALAKAKWQPAVRTIMSYGDHPAHINALRQSVLDHYETLDFEPQKLVLSFHGLPQRYLEIGDPYHCQCQRTSRLLRESLGWPERAMQTCFQSVFGKEEWLRPYTVETVAQLPAEGSVDIAMMAPGFSSDCVETLEEIQDEIKEAFMAAGGRNFSYIPCLNAAEAHINMLETIILENLIGWINIPEQGSADSN